ncbi:Lethal(2)denticleless protein [Mytilinidion resinicola]|uniref:Lethal(2)denticleless protein n=1 Tax=Mytilinidion resinicola TaxID=574789 RepID=A0A6A6YKC0_9PEZI|nr:Lethal(2)denticleless protein [Mytilinidion resinicola]KAF2808993.1 Lethal(2)denticleless protein [Mytilinidion resinicola]
MPPSSPLGPPSSTGSRKLKKPPPITPKRFTRFFTPRSSVHGSSRFSSLSRSGRQLQDITRTVNRRNNVHNQTPRKTVNFADLPTPPNDHIVTPQRDSRKRKLSYLSPESSPIQSSPIQSSPSKRVRTVSHQFTILEDIEAELETQAPFLEEDDRPRPQPIRRSRALGSTARILQRSFGGAATIGRGVLQDNCTRWQDHTANFSTSPTDLLRLPNSAVPFCTASCNTNPFVAIGDEDGYVHLIDTEESHASFSKPHISVRLHNNAVMDLAFSSDDLLLATASGDQSAQIMDVCTQKCVHVLAKHTSSVKQVCFQPGDDKVIATSGRDGTVQIWDLRCSGSSDVLTSTYDDNAPFASTIRTIAGAHANNVFAGGASMTSGAKSFRDSGKKEPSSRDISVTALAFLPRGRSHMLLTASDASTTVKLWDIRGRYSRRGPPTPISVTKEPESHIRHRRCAINSLTLNTDGSRFYVLSKDHTIYAYSTSHLVLGHAPEFNTSDSTRQRYMSAGKEGLGPMYGFRHPDLQAGSFYVKTSLRKASGDKSELLAVGSSKKSPILFPTDESFLRREPQHQDDDSDELPLARSSSRSPSTRPSLMRTSSGTVSSTRDTIPIYQHGTPLIRGHEHEVTNVAWTTEGSLVSVGDDFTSRCWREGPRARELRLSGESGGQRWASGWADVAGGFDDDE